MTIKSEPANRPLHVILCFVDHFEPFHGGCDFKQAKWRVTQWVEKYPKIAFRHRDASGIAPQHTWFYPPHLDHIFLKDLVRLCRDGYGEIEMHLHHNHMTPFPDTSETLKTKILKCLDDYANEYKIFCLPDGSKRFAFIHGDWSLDNACGKKICGVNDEIQILNDCGCYADFTFPTLGKAQPAFSNSIYYARDNPKLPKSYNWGKSVCVRNKPSGDLMIIQGIVGLRWNSRTHKFRPSIEASNIDRMDSPFPKRVDYWIRNAVKVKGHPDWLFIKIHTHGCNEVDFDCLLGEPLDNMFSYLEQYYNDNESYVLHYVTAREMYNIIKAAENGQKGNPDNYRDYIIPKYIYLRR